jgi:hypothetical protein
MPKALFPVVNPFTNSDANAVRYLASFQLDVGATTTAIPDASIYPEAGALPINPQGDSLLPKDVSWQLNMDGEINWKGADASWKPTNLPSLVTPTQWVSWPSPGSPISRQLGELGNEAIAKIEFVQAGGAR